MQVYALFVLISIQNLLQIFASTIVLNWNISVGDQNRTLIYVGDTVSWIWRDSEPHSVQSTSTDNTFESSSVIAAYGYVYSVTFDYIGEYSYQCSIHSSMKGVIDVVTATPYPTSIPTVSPCPSITPSLSPSEAPLLSPYPSFTPSTSTPTSTLSTSTPTSTPSTSPITSTPSTLPPTSTINPTQIPTMTPTPNPTRSPTPVPSAQPTTLSELTAKELTSMPLLSSGYGRARNWILTLYVREYRVTAGPVTFTTRTFCTHSYCSYPGPTIRFRPGDNLTLTLVNELGPQEVINSTHSSVRNGMHSPNTTNFYTHGLHVDPAINSVFRTASPGETLTYRYSIKENHAPGIHWYHSHAHGSSAMQLMGGLAGGIVVEPDLDDKSLKYPTSLKNSRSILMIVTNIVLNSETVEGNVSQGCGVDWSCDPVSQYPLCSGNEKSSPFNPFRSYSLQELSAETGSTLDMNFQLNTSNEGMSSIDLINGQYQPSISLVRNSPTILRIVHAAGAGPLRLVTSDSDKCTMTVLAWDGVYIKNRSPQLVVNVVAGGRVDIELYCDTVGVFTMYNLGNGLFFHIVVTATGTTKRIVTDEHLAGIRRPYYLTDLYDVNATVDQWYSLSVNQAGKNSSECGFWLGSGPDCSSVQPYGPLYPNASIFECPFSQFEGSRGTNPGVYIERNKMVTFMGSVHEWTLYGLGSSHHALTIQPHHFQIISVESDNYDYRQYYEVGQWRDTLPPVASAVRVRFRVAQFTGENAVNCHFLRHQDLGMMDSYLVLSFADFQALTEAPTSYPTETPDDDLIGPLGFFWVIIVAAGVVFGGLGLAAYVTFFSSSTKASVFPRNEFQDL